MTAMTNNAINYNFNTYNFLQVYNNNINHNLLSTIIIVEATLYNYYTTRQRWIANKTPLRASHIY